MPETVRKLHKHHLKCKLLLFAQVWLTQPLVDLEAIIARHDIVEAFVTDIELRERLRDQSLRGGRRNSPSDLVTYYLCVLQHCGGLPDAHRAAGPPAGSVSPRCRVNLVKLSQ